MTQRGYGEKLSGGGGHDGHGALRIGGCGSDGLRVCSTRTLYVESHVWGQGEVRTKHVVSNG